IPDVTRIRAELDLAAPAAALEWLEVEGRRAGQDGRTIIQYQLDGRFPIQQLDVALAGNHAVQWRLGSRDDPAAEWRVRAGPWGGPPGGEGAWRAGTTRLQGGGCVRGRGRPGGLLRPVVAVARPRRRWRRRCATVIGA